jgi:hypothetical protein
MTDTTTKCTTIEVTLSSNQLIALREGKYPEPVDDKKLSKIMFNPSTLKYIEGLLLTYLTDKAVIAMKGTTPELAEEFFKQQLEIDTCISLLRHLLETHKLTTTKTTNSTSSTGE